VTAMKSIIGANQWAVAQSSMDGLLSMDNASLESMQALATRNDRYMDGAEEIKIRNGVAIIPIAGILTKKDSFMAWMFGRSTYELLAKDYTAAMNNPDVICIVLDIDSPGGMVSGCSEFADIVYNSRGMKPVVAYVGGDACSAAYLIASAAERIVINDTAELGSVGAIFTIVDTTKMEKDAGVKVWEIVSTQSPYKRLDPSKSEHMARYQARIDDMAGVIIEKVARNRAISYDSVLENYGRGDVFVGQTAVDAGMAESLGSFEGLMAELTAEKSQPNGNYSAAASGQTNGEQRMSLYLTEKAPAAGDEQRKMAVTAENIVAMCPEIAETLRAQGAEAKAAEMKAASDAANSDDATAVTKERERIEAITGSEEAKGREDLSKYLAFSTAMSATDAAAMLAKAPIAPIVPIVPAAPADQFSAVMASVQNPTVGADLATDEDTNESAALRSAALGKEYNCR
jgi:ClpP class serine protease